MKKILPVSLLAIWVACPALAENFPNDGYMLENKTYDNAATYENMGVYENYVDAIAEYTDCPAGSYCDSTGQHSCPGDYPNSAAGAGASTECYTACTVQNANIAHATAVTGNKYNGGTDTCSATDCDDGWHTTGGGIDIIATIGTDEAENVGYRSNSGVGYNDNENAYGIIDNGTFAVDYGNKGIIRGHTQCSSRDVTTPWYATDDGNGNYTFADDHFTETLPDSSGDLCYCKLDSYTLVGGASQGLSGPWVFFGRTGAPCATDCASACAGNLHDNDSGNLAFRAAILGSLNLGSALATCAANTITINWSDVDDDGDATTMSTDVLYDGDIDTPVKAATYPGKIFTGWRFVRPDDEYGS